MRTAKRSDDRAILGPRLALAALAAWAAANAVGIGSFGVDVELVSVDVPDVRLEGAEVV